MPYIKTNSDLLYIKDTSVDVVKEIEPGIYNCIPTKRGLEFLNQTMPIVPTDLYSNIDQTCDMIINTFRSRPNKNTGILLSGLKGTGKTLLSNLIINRINLPVFKINNLSVFQEFIDFFNSLIEPFVIFYDELDKSITSKHGNDKELGDILSFLDGDNVTTKLVLFTANNINFVPRSFISRPGRIFYNIKFTGLDEVSIIKYIDKNLVIPSFSEKEIEDKKLEILKELEALIYTSTLTFDMLSNLLEEIIRYPNKSLEHILNVFNIETISTSISGKLFVIINNKHYEIPNKLFELDTKSYNILHLSWFEVKTDKNIYAIRLHRDFNFEYVKDNKVYFKAEDYDVRSLENNIILNDSSDYKEPLVCFFTPVLTKGWKVNPNTSENTLY